ncbi:MAG: hypothetical protein CSA62_00820 [Planctomycetota bacterium]|nr:MAG: hypothetical protein CSA62_00820 [Planctomycetota bacterium]
MTLSLQVEYDRRLHYAMQRNGVSLVKELRLSNDADQDLEDLEIVVEVEEGFAEPWTQHLRLLRAGGAHRLRVDALRVDTARLRSLQEREQVRLRVVVRQAGQEPELARAALKIEVLALRDWGGLRSLPPLLAAYVLPADPVIHRLREKSASLLEEATGSSALSGYQQRDPARLRATLKAGYLALQSLGLGYTQAPADFAEEGQKLCFPRDLIETGQGTCLDLSLLASGLFEAMGLQPIVILVEGHAFVGLWCIPERFAECVVLDPMRLRKRVDLGDICLMESSAITRGEGLSFEEAERRARAYIEDEESFRAAIDIAEARRQGFQPLQPLGQERAEGDSADRVFEAPATRASQEIGLGGQAQPLGLNPGEEPVSVEEKVLSPAQRRIDSWKRRLLDLSYRNRLLAFRETKRSLPLLLADPASIEDALASRQCFVVRPRPGDKRDGEDTLEENALERRERLQIFARAELDRRRLTSTLTERELEKRLKEIWRHYRSSLEETGANTLYLAVGMLHYREAHHSATGRVAPLLLLPLEIQRRSVRDGYVLRVSEDEPQVNSTLLEKLRTDFPIDTRGLDELPEDENGYDVSEILRRVRRAVIDQDGFEVRDEAWVAVFSFQKFLMWRDLQDRSETLLKNPVVEHLVARTGKAYEAEEEFPLPEDLDERLPFGETLCPLNADSSQLAAVLASSSGRSFVLEGPPGTGKSQTITNLIAQNLAEGRRVLFVSEKRAALDVVSKRLGRVGLGPFCLELHSDKASKREVLEQLREATELVRSKEPEEWESHARKIEEERRKLNDYVHELHKVRSFGESVYRLRSELCGLRDAPQIRLAAARRSGLDRSWVETRREAVQRLKLARERVISISGHLFAAVRRREWRPGLPEELDRMLCLALERLQAHGKALVDFAGRLGLGEEFLTASRAGELVTLANELVSGPSLPRELFEAGAFTELEEEALGAIAQLRAKQELEARVSAYFAESVLKLDLTDLLARCQRAAQSYWPLSWLRGRGVRKALRRHLAQGSKLLSYKLLAVELQRAIDLRERQQCLAAPEHPGHRLFARRAWAAGTADPERLEDLLASVRCLRGSSLRLLEGLSEELRANVRSRLLALATDEREALAEGTEYRQVLKAIVVTREEWGRSQEQLGELLDLDPSAFASSQSFLPELQQRLESWREQRHGGLRDWVFWREVEHQALELGLSELVRALAEDELPPDEIERAFERGFRESLLLVTQDEVPALRNFHSGDHQRRIENFRDLDKRGLELAERCVHARLCARVPQVGYSTSDSSEMGILQRELRKKRRHLPPRKLFEQIPNLLGRLKPCVLMSPLSVASYLDPGTAPFDLVVFDEASQITVWDSVGALARGKAAVVVGDTKQLPPTMFFQRFDEDLAPDDLDLEELESILDEFSAAGFQGLRLHWHYRSRHESLIAFSNYHYYDNRLHSFPSPVMQPERMGVSLVPVEDGVYDRSRTRSNLKEAESLVADLVARLRKDGHRHSHGVVTFSKAQQELIEDLLDKARHQDPQLERYWVGEEPVFVKNLENVQGDERDVILFSICYGSDVNGKVAMNFGPMNLVGGERRLNVAITRARRQVIVHATLRPDQIDLSRTQAVGVRHLRTFLDYAQRGPVALGEAVQLHGDAARFSPFEEQVASALRSKGHEVERQVGCSSYRIDIAVRDPGDPGRFLLGIECDGSFYANAKSARDRDRIRASVMKGLGWRLKRIWSQDWWRDPDGQLLELEAAIAEAIAAAQERAASAEAAEAAEASESGEAALAEPVGRVDEEAPAAASEQDSQPDPEPAPPPVNDPGPSHAGLPYREAELPKKLLDREDLDTPLAEQALREWVDVLLLKEAPILHARLLHRAAELFDARMTAKARKRIEELLDLYGLREIDQVVWHHEQDPEAWLDYREAGPREAGELPLPELVNAGLAVLATELALSRDDLAREMARRFGFSRMGRRLEEAMQRGIDQLLEQGGAKEEGGRVLLP